jgi:CDP-diacylglycerol--glycerol-3-phosphate 3-phosphatidyltransferase
MSIRLTTHAVALTLRGVVPPAHPTKRPLITANQVTFARLALLPLGSWLMYQGVNGQWAALVFLTLVGCTDFVDGWLARRQGPTVLGGLMDPIADKVFVAVTFLPMIDLGWAPWYLVWLLFLREFMITSARSSYERRQMSLKSSYLGKVKTWFQMCGGAMFFLFRTVQRPWVMHTIVLVLAIAPLLAGGLFWLIKRRRWRGSIVFFFSFGALAAVEILLGAKVTSVILGWAVVAITWLSGGAYLTGLRELQRRKPIDAEDLVRLFGALALPVLATLLMAYQIGPSWPILIITALEFANGGLDNLLANAGEQPGWPAWAVRVVSQNVLLGAALFLGLRHGDPTLIFGLVVGALAITAAASGVFFYRRRSAYLSDRVQTHAKVGTTAPAPWL